MTGKSKLILAAFIIGSIGLSVLAYFGIGDKHYFGVQNINQGLDLQGGVSITYEAAADNPTSQDMNAAKSLIRRRLDNRGYTEAEVALSGSTRLQVDIPGVEDAEQAIAELGKTALLTFQDENGNILLTGADVANARRELTSNSYGGSEISVSLTFNDAGKQLFEDATAANIGKPIYIYLDDELISSPTVSERISGGASSISGSFTAEYADYLATSIREGSLPFSLNILSVSNVGARLGANALSTSILAGLIGFVLVFLFMAFIYKVSGLCADLALIIYVGLMLVILSLFNITLTLPGIAGIILSVGMAVDANVVIFERLNEELATGRALRSAIDAAFKRALPAILDGNVTTLMAAAVLFWLGTGPVKGFAQTLAIGILLSMFSAVVLTRVIIKNLVGAGLNNPKIYGRR